MVVDLRSLFEYIVYIPERYNRDSPGPLRLGNDDACYAEGDPFYFRGSSIGTLKCLPRKNILGKNVLLTSEKSHGLDTQLQPRKTKQFPTAWG